MTFGSEKSRKTHGTSKRKTTLPSRITPRISGRGTVVTGTIKAGTLRVNDRILIMGKSGRLATQVGGLEAFHKIMEQAEAGEYVGVLLRDVKSTDVEKGDLLLKG